MESFLGQKTEEKGINKGLLIGAIVGIIAFAAAFLLLYGYSAGSMEDQKAQILDGSFREGSPQFAEVTKDIIIATDKNTVEYPDGFGNISMSIVGSIRNKGPKVINALEVNVAVVDQFNEVVKEKRVLVVPGQIASLEPNEIIPITLSLDGFSKKDDRANIRWKVTAIRTE